MAKVLPNIRSNPLQSTRGQRMIFTGPDGIGDYRTKQYDFKGFIGIGPKSPESTGDLDYLFRAAPGTPPQLPKDHYVGGVGWGVQYCGAINANALHSAHRFKRGEFRTALEDRITHKYQNPWFVPPLYLDRQDAGARGRLAWTNSLYEDYCKQENRDFLLNKRRRYIQRKEMSSSRPNSTLPQIRISR
ncbi:protein SPMIP2 [Engraulis encrasicolus]|uniref:protein SPMIP2 n=1 Tax=Engraulis encrasicolus TaxID=184585 RepID=UPI002FD79929